MVTIHIFDIESGVDIVRARALMPPFDPESVKTGNLRDDDKIAAKIAERRLYHERDWMKNAALYPETGKVLAIGIMPFGARDEIVFHANESDEAEILASFWDFYMTSLSRDNRRFCGFGIFHFDLPFIILRCRMLNVQTPPVNGLRQGRYFNGNLFCDLQDEWLLGRSRSECACSLDHVAKSLEVGAKTGEAKNFGDVYALDVYAALSYLRNDLLITRAVADKLKLL